MFLWSKVKCYAVWLSLRFDCTLKRCVALKAAAEEEDQARCGKTLATKAIVFMSAYNYQMHNSSAAPYTTSTTWFFTITTRRGESAFAHASHLCRLAFWSQFVEDCCVQGTESPWTIL